MCMNMYPFHSKCELVSVSVCVRLCVSASVHVSVWIMCGHVYINTHVYENV